MQQTTEKMQYHSELAPALDVIYFSNHAIANSNGLATVHDSFRETSKAFET